MYVEQYSKSYRSVNNLACLCAYCHNIKSRIERLAALEEEQDQRQGRSQVESEE